MHFFSVLTKHHIAFSSVYIIKAFLVKPKVSHAVALTCMLKKRLMDLYWVNELVHSHYPWRVNCFVVF